MKFTLGIALSPLDQLTGLAGTAEECGFASIALPDSLFYSESVSAAYPYTVDGSRFWSADTPWCDPLVAAAAMGAVTTRIRFYTQVLKLNPRNPVLLARQVGSVATLTGNRFGLGVGLGWAPEESLWCGGRVSWGPPPHPRPEAQPPDPPLNHRGRRADEAIEILRLVLGGGMVSYDGEFYSFGKLRMSPAPSEPVPIYVGGHSDAALRRAARLGDGWTSAMITFDDLRDTIERLAKLRTGYGRTGPFEIQAVCVDRFGLDGYRRQADIGVTDAIVVPWLFYGVGFDAPLKSKQDGIRRFADEIMARL